MEGKPGKLSVHNRESLWLLVVVAEKWERCFRWLSTMAYKINFILPSKVRSYIVILCSNVYKYVDNIINI